jgi:basic membrane protein A
MHVLKKLSSGVLLATAVTITSVHGALAFSACQVTDVGGIDDASFNQTAWKGVQDAMSEYGIEGRYVESQSGSDYEPNLNSMRDNNCDIIFAVGFLMGDATKKAAEANPAQNYSILDYLYDPTISNVVGQIYATNEGGFMAGYLAAGMSRTRVVGTFGGMNIPPVTAFMDGFAHGVTYYNSEKDANVQVLGWNPASKEGLFTGNFESLDDGRAFAQNLYDEGADIVMPVAGPVGKGSAALANELGPDALKIIGVDADMTITDPERAHVYLTSVVKRMDNTVKAVIKQAIDGEFSGGVLLGNVANGGVALAPYHSFDASIPAELKSEVDAIKAGIMNGSINVGG